MPVIQLALDMSSDAAALPGKGDDYVTFTHTTDLAKLVGASSTLPVGSWEKETFVGGDRPTLLELVKLAEEVKGIKIEPKYDSIDTLRQGKITELPGHTHMYPYFAKEALQGLLASLELMITKGAYDFKGKSTVTQEKLSEVKPRKMRELLETAYAKQ